MVLDLSRMMEIVFESEVSGPAIIDKLGHDTITSSLLLLYSLHPDDLETRVHKAMERIAPRLRKVSCSADLVHMQEGIVRVRVTTSGHSCGSSANDVRAIVEEGVYELAPDVASLDILGLEERSNSGFVAIESLVGHNLVATAHNSHALVTESGQIDPCNRPLRKGRPACLKKPTSASNRHLACFASSPVRAAQLRVLWSTATYAAPACITTIRTSSNSPRARSSAPATPAPCSSMEWRNRGTNVYPGLPGICLTSK